MKKYFLIEKPTPVLNISDFLSVFGGRDKKTLKQDSLGHTREIEFIALKNMVFEILSSTPSKYIYKVKCNFYKSTNLYIDVRFGCFLNKKKSPNLKYILNPYKIIKKLNSYINLPYVWGANYSKGIKDLLKYYPLTSQNKDLMKRWTLKGLDCSGLLFDATNGYTPRNTTDLLFYKDSLPIENLNIYEIQKILKPLDLIVFKGHVIVIIDQLTTLESREKIGVYKSNLIIRLNEIIKTKKATNTWKKENDFVINRWLNIDQFCL